MRTAQFGSAQGSCTSDGVKIEVLVDGKIDDAQTQYNCNGVNGQSNIYIYKFKSKLLLLV